MEGDNMDLKNKIVQMAIKSNACSEGLEELGKSKDRTEMIKCFMDNYKFCLSRHVPSAEFISANFHDIMHYYGIYSNEIISCKSQKEMVFVGHCFATIEVTEPKMYRIWVADKSELKISAYNGARIIVDALDYSSIIVDNNKDSYVTVYLYGQSTCCGANKIVQKGDSYEI